MAIEVMTRVWELSPEKGGKLLLLLALADNANAQNLAWPSQKTLAKKTRMDPRHVRRMLSELAEIGEIIIEPRTDSKYNTNLYHVISGMPTPQKVAIAEEIIKRFPKLKEDILSPILGTKKQKGGHFVPINEAILPPINEDIFDNKEAIFDNNEDIFDNNEDSAMSSYPFNLLTVKTEKDINIQKTWNTIRLQLMVLMGESSNFYREYVQPLKPFDYSDHALVLATENKEHLPWLKSRVPPYGNAILQSVVNDPAARLAFIVPGVTL